MIEIQFTKLHPDAIPPRQAHPLEDAGWDLFSLEDVTIPTFSASDDKLPLQWIRTGIAVALPPGYYGRIVGRSSSASKGLHVVEGVMDSGYRGEQMVRVVSLWKSQVAEGQSFTRRFVRRGESLAQLIVQEVRPVSFVEVDILPPSLRGTNGFGSTG